MQATSILLLYETLAALMSKMLVAARENAWEELIRLDNECGQYIQALQSNETDTQKLTGVDREKQIDFLQQILKNNQLIQDLIQPNLSELSDKIKSNHNEQKLLKTYNNFGG